MLKAFITTKGDRSVGIWEENIEVHFKDRELTETTAGERERKALREDLFDAFNGICGEPPVVRFEDECLDCGTRLHRTMKGNINKKCPDKSCISNYKPEDED